MKLRRLTSTGIEQFDAYLSQLRANPTLGPPAWLLEDEASSEGVSEIMVVTTKFPDRLAAAKYLHDLFGRANLGTIDKDVGLWAWLTLLHFDQVCPVVKGASRKPFKETFRYIPSPNNYQKYYRHLLYGPYVIFQAHRERVVDAMCLLAGPLHVSNDIIEQIASRLELVANPTVVAAATALYLEPESREFKYGARGSGGGSPRRFHAVLEQFDLTYDLFGMRTDALLELLPKEFDRFRNDR